MCDRIIWGKAINAGQTCVAPDYLMVHESQIDAVTEGLKQALERQFGKDQKVSTAFGRNVSSGHTQRLKEMLQEAEEAGCTLLSGGSALVDVEAKYVPTSLVIVDPAKHKSLKILEEEP